MELFRKTPALKSLTRIAERCLQHIAALQAEAEVAPSPPVPVEPPTYGKVRERIAGLL